MKETWIVETDAATAREPGHIIRVDNRTGLPIAIVYAPQGGNKESCRRQRNRAFLMAAAPDLLEACKIALRLIAPKVDNSDAMGWGVGAESALRAAIAKATTP